MSCQYLISCSARIAPLLDCLLSSSISGGRRRLCLFSRIRHTGNVFFVFFCAFFHGIMALIVILMITSKSFSELQFKLYCEREVETKFQKNVSRVI